MKHSLSPWQRRAVVIVTAAGPVGCTQYAICTMMQRRYNDLTRPLAKLVEWGILDRRRDGVFTTKQEQRT